MGVLHVEVYEKLAERPGYLEPGDPWPGQWVAIAEGPDGDPGELGRGETPQHALLHLARILEPIRGSASG